MNASMSSWKNHSSSRVLRLPIPQQTPGGHPRKKNLLPHRESLCNPRTSNNCPSWQRQSSVHHSLLTSATRQSMSSNGRQIITTETNLSATCQTRSVHSAARCVVHSNNCYFVGVKLILSNNPEQSVHTNYLTPQIHVY